MKSISTLVLTSLFATVSLATSALAGDHAKHTAVTESLRSLSGASFDQRFLAIMREHDQHGLELATLASQRAQRDAVKDYAKDAAETQREQLSDIEKLVADTRSDAAHASNATSTRSAATVGSTDTTAHDTQMSTAAKHELADTNDKRNDMMEKLESATGAEFDRQFLDLMAKHHEMGQELAALAQSRSTSDDVKDFAEKIQKAQAKELEKLKDLGAS